MEGVDCEGVGSLQIQKFAHGTNIANKVTTTHDNNLAVRSRMINLLGQRDEI